jgi:hypothetical protein
MVFGIGLKAKGLNIEVLFFFDVFDVEADVFDFHDFSPLKRIPSETSFGE